MLSMIDFFPYLTIFEHPIIVGSFSYGLFVLLSEVAFKKFQDPGENGWKSVVPHLKDFYR